jgi:putative ABC transport system permease protein
MNVFHKVTRESLRKNRLRTIVTIVGVLLSAAMVCAVTTIVVSFQGFYRDSEVYETGDWYGRVERADQEVRQALEADSRVAHVASAEILGYAASESQNEDKPYIYLLGADATFFDVMPVRAVGRLPEQEGEILVPVHYLSVGNGGASLQIGDTVELALGERMVDGYPLNQSNPLCDDEALQVRETRTYRVVGFYERPDFEDYSAPGFSALTVQENEPQTGLYDVYLLLRDAKQETLDRVMARYSDAAEGGISMNWDYLRTQGNFRYDNYSRFLLMFVIIFVLLIMLGSVSLIYSAFSISVSERTRQFGLLASIGATRAQLRRTVYAEAGTVALIGIPLGLLAGCGGMWVTIRLLSPRISGMIGAREVAMRFAASPLSLLAAALIALATVFLSAQIPARRAMRISPIEAIRQSRDVRAAARHGGSYRLFGLPGLLSSRYFHRSRKKYRATIFSLAMSVLLFVSASTYGMYLTESVTESVNLPPYDLSYSTGEGEKDVAMLPALRAADGVEKVWFASCDNGDYVLDRNEFASGYRSILEKTGAGTEKARSYSACYLDDETFNAILASIGMTRAEYDAAPGAIVCDHTSVTYYDENNRLSYTGRVLNDGVTALRTFSADSLEDGSKYVYTAYEDGGYVSYYYNETKQTYQPRPASFGDGIAIVGRTETQLTNSGSDSLVLYYPFSMAKGIARNTGSLMLVTDDAKQAQKSLEEVVNASGETYTEGNLYDAREEYRDAENALIVVRVFAYGFITLMSLICVANVFNTTTTNVLLRRRDFAMLRSAGMTRGGLNRMICYECLLYGTRALLIGLPLSVALAFLMYRSASFIGASYFRLDWTAVIIASVMVFLVVFLSMMYAMRKIKRDNPVDALKNETT